MVPDLRVDPAGPYAAPQSVTVWATLADSGYAWADPLPDGWGWVNPVSAIRQVYLFDPECPNAELAKSCPVVDGPLAVGDTITYTVTLDNTGHMYLLDIVATESRAGSFDSPFPFLLSPGEHATRTFTSTVTVEDVANGHVDNALTVVAAYGRDFEAPHGQTPEPLPTITRHVVAECPATIIVPTETPTTPSKPTATPDPTATPGEAPITSLPDTGQGVGDRRGGQAAALIALAMGFLGLAVASHRLRRVRRPPE